MAIPASSVGVERLFNMARDICHYRRGNLKPDTIGMLMLIKHHDAKELETEIAVSGTEDLSEDPQVNNDLTRFWDEDMISSDEEQNEEVLYDQDEYLDAQDRVIGRAEFEEDAEKYELPSSLSNKSITSFKGSLSRKRTVSSVQVPRSSKYSSQVASSPAVLAKKAKQTMFAKRTGALLDQGIAKKQRI